MPHSRGKSVHDSHSQPLCPSMQPVRDDESEDDGSDSTGSSVDDDAPVELLRRETITELAPFCTPLMLHAYEFYPDEKLALCGIQRDVDGNASGVCQLTLAGLPGDETIPWYLQPTCRPDEARIELLEVTRAAGGMKGLLRWASEVARRQGAQHIGIDRRYNDELRTLRLAGFREVGCSWSALPLSCFRGHRIVRMSKRLPRSHSPK